MREIVSMLEGGKWNAKTVSATNMLPLQIEDWLAIQRLAILDLIKRYNFVALSLLSVVTGCSLLVIVLVQSRFFEFFEFLNFLKW